MRLRQPRNAAAIVDLRASGKLADGDCLVVSFVGYTAIDEPHVFVTPGNRYDWRFARGLFAVIVTGPGLDISQVSGDIYAATMPYPTLVDFEQQFVASIVPRSDSRGFKTWPRRRGGDAWLALFG